MTPTVVPETELTGRVKLTLAPATKISFHHYAACKVVTVEGGTVEVSSFGYEVAEGGKLLSEQTRQCAARVRLIDARGQTPTVAGMVFRGADQQVAQKYPPAPSFTLVGKGAERVAKIDVAEPGMADKPGRFRAVLDMRGRNASWPTGNSPLAPGGTYALRVLDASGAVLGQMQFVVGDVAKPPGQEFEILRLD